ncbi:MAG: hypothetical protein RXQ56_04525 [Thermoproteus sp.]|jgi:hypothetical protein|nr:MAG: hypothetical protein AT711_02010 [Thermoproteus sp. CIS_19]KUO87463.1 MAG: hypothetical protein AT715_03110 [Thermoproteus sp. JCHS_4]MDT7869354.1 hypothetical protein [Thermoproteus sp.]MDT7882002.1 hypothetical protein [Thermoproteus sp.]
MEREGLQAVNAWIQAFNRIGKSESNFHSFELLRGGDSVTATLVLQGIESSGTCLMGPYALASISLVGDKVSLKLASGNYQRCGQGPDETAERREPSQDKVIDLGNDPELVNAVRSVKTEGDFVSLLEVALELAASA